MTWFGSGSVMVWGGISLGGRTALHVLARGSLTAIRYRDEILRPLVRPYAGAVGPGFLLMQDNARPHVAGVCQQFLQDEGIDAMDWPARSPDLNPIEHIWDIMSRSIHHQRHVAPQTVQELADALVQVWEEIPQETIRHLIRSMPRLMAYDCESPIKMRKWSAGGFVGYLLPGSATWPVENSGAALHAVASQREQTGGGRATSSPPQPLRSLAAKPMVVDQKLKTAKLHQGVFHLVVAQISNQGQMADSVYGVVWVSGLLIKRCESSGPWWQWGYGMGRPETSRQQGKGERAMSRYLFKFSKKKTFPLLLSNSVVCKHFPWCFKKKKLQQSLIFPTEMDQSKATQDASAKRQMGESECILLSPAVRSRLRVTGIPHYTAECDKSQRRAPPPTQPLQFSLQASNTGPQYPDQQTYTVGECLQVSPGVIPFLPLQEKCFNPRCPKGPYALYGWFVEPSIFSHSPTGELQLTL
ncbi:hypothetical protein L3Q82_000757 [Scortum barcoo]|uniref:Uncharacterized protein n=1 Tax=Scortum barcoo TaxID=214431 RepID=A0ACB8WD40_9TELE|nr:hypothetical protein L3Q82_000757 [Scortum barcoo]